MWEYISGRLSEKSTWASLGMLVTVIGWQISPEQWAQISMIGMGLGGLIGSLVPAKTNKAAVQSVIAKTVTADAMRDIPKE